MDKVTITINRQYGSGGKTIGEMLAKDLHIHYYNRDIIRLASIDSGIAEQLFGRMNEQLNLSPFEKLTKKQHDDTLIPPEDDKFTSDDNLFNYQAKIIRELAEKESCVIIGRCADHVLKDAKNVVRVFIYADEEFCFERAMERNSMTPHEMKNYIKRVDKHRAEFYKYYTGKEWTDARNYDLCLNSSELGFEKCVEIIKEYIKIRLG